MQRAHPPTQNVRNWGQKAWPTGKVKNKRKKIGEKGTWWEIKSLKISIAAQLHKFDAKGDDKDRVKVFFIVEFGAGEHLVEVLGIVLELISVELKNRRRDLKNRELCWVVQGKNVEANLHKNILWTKVWRSSLAVQASHPQRKYRGQWYSALPLSLNKRKNADFFVRIVVFRSFNEKLSKI